MTARLRPIEEIRLEDTQSYRPSLYEPVLTAKTRSAPDQLAQPHILIAGPSKGTRVFSLRGDEFSCRHAEKERADQTGTGCFEDHPHLRESSVSFHQTRETGTNRAHGWIAGRAEHTSRQARNRQEYEDNMVWTCVDIELLREV